MRTEEMGEAVWIWRKNRVEERAKVSKLVRTRVRNCEMIFERTRRNETHDLLERTLITSFLLRLISELSLDRLVEPKV